MRHSYTATKQGSNMTREQLISQRDVLDAAYRLASLNQRAVREQVAQKHQLVASQAANGLTPDVVKFDPEYVAADRATKSAFAALREFNGRYARAINKR